MNMSKEAKEITLTAELTDNEEVVDRLDKMFFLVNSEEQKEIESNGLDETLTEFVQEIETMATDRNLAIKNKGELYTKALMSLVLLFADSKTDCATLRIPVEFLKGNDSEEANDGRTDNIE
jgi:hypothetical protein